VVEHLQLSWRETGRVEAYSAPKSSLASRRQARHQTGYSGSSNPEETKDCRQLLNGERIVD
jgi:hypothetical protein